MAITLQDATKNETRKLEVRLAQNQLELEQVLSLRYDVFNLEMGEGLPQSRQTQKDRDEYDFYCDHLIVIDKTNHNKIVGTYRILRRDIAKKNIGFYSENEFDLHKIYDIQDEVAEVGRSCVHSDYRGGSVISLLWIGLGEYMNRYNLRYLMGCGSIHSTSPELASAMSAFLKHKNAIIGDKLNVEPLNTYRLQGFDPNYVIENPKETFKKIPPLLKGYLRLGSKMNVEPALDAVFGTTDFFIFFDRNHIDAKYGKHYLPE
ncbi:MAG: GNAT family N-acyltransferase [Spirochaetota bacterium]